MLRTVYTCIQQIFEADPDDEGVWAVACTCATVAGHGREGGRRRERGSAPGEGYRIGGFSRQLMMDLDLDLDLDRPWMDDMTDMPGVLKKNGRGSGGGKWKLVSPLAITCHFHLENS